MRATAEARRHFRIMPEENALPADAGFAISMPGSAVPMGRALRVHDHGLRAGRGSDARCALPMPALNLRKATASADLGSALPRKPWGGPCPAVGSHDALLMEFFKARIGARWPPKYHCMEYLKNCHEKDEGALVRRAREA